MSGLDEKGLEAAANELLAHGEFSSIPSQNKPNALIAAQEAIRAYLASATPADVGELVERLRSHAKDCDMLVMPEGRPQLAREAATALERVVRERDDARADHEWMTANRNKWQDATTIARRRAESAEAKLAEARKVIEPFAAAARAIGNEPGAVQFYTDTGYRELPEDALRAARRWIEETK